MSTAPLVYIVQLPSPAGRNVFREWAGGMGTALPSERDHPGHDQRYYDIPYFQFLYIARGLELKGIAQRYFDHQARERFDLDAFTRELRADRPRVLLSVVSLPSLNADLALLRTLRDVAPEMRIVLIGPSARLLHEKILSEGDADFVLEGDEELLAPALIERILADPERAEPESCWYREEGEVRQAPAHTRMKDLDFLDFPAYHLLDFSRYRSDFFFGRTYRYMTVYTSKGCAYDCAYCPYPFGFGQRFIYRSPHRVVADIERLQREFGVEQICFRDQVFTVNHKHTRAICELLIERALPIVWICETRYDRVTPELLELMHRAGCREIHYGLESADEEIFQSIGKPGGPVSLERFEQAIAWTKAAGMRCHLHMILGLPGESWRTVRTSLAFLRRTRPHSVQTALLSPYPGTPLYEQLRTEGRLHTADWESFTGFDAVQPTEHLSVEELQRAKEYIAWNWDKGPWNKLWLRLRKLLGRAAKVPAHA